MSRALDFSMVHLLLGLPLFVALCITAVASIITLEQLERELKLEPWIFWFSSISSACIIPFTFYFVFFTKFNNPFRKSEDIQPKGGP